MALRKVFMAGIVGLDIGGANLKAAHSDGTARSRAFALWKNPQGLGGALKSLLGEMPAADRLAVTMTGELCDCFATRREGVRAILGAVGGMGPSNAWVWSTEGQFLDPAEARDNPLRVAAANWHVLATFAGRFAPRGTALVLDVGSTTTDLIPLFEGRPVPQGLTDPDRLRSRELVYTGVSRTPLCSLLGLPYAAEFFATALDMNLVLNHLPPDPDNVDTADGRPATLSAAHARLARMMCGDGETCSREETTRLAGMALARQVTYLAGALEEIGKRLPQPPETIILSGSGEFLGRLVLRELKAFPVERVLSFREEFGPDLSRAACAYAAAVLAGEGKGPFSKNLPA